RLVVGERLRHVVAQFLYARGARRVGREKFRRRLFLLVRLLLPFLLHALPERHGDARVVARLGHEDEADLVRLGLLRAAEREDEAEIRAGAEERADRAAADGADEADARVDDLRAAQALARVAQQRVRDLVAEDDREAGFVARDGKDAGVDADLAAGEAEGVHLLGVV